MAWAAVPISAALAAINAAPIAFPAFPRDPSFTTVSAWAGAQTDIAPGDLLDVEDGFAFALMPAAKAQGPRRLRVEAVEPRAWRSLGGRSAVLRVELSCTPPRATPLSLDVYAGANRLGPLRPHVDLGALPLPLRTQQALAFALCTPAVQARPLDPAADVTTPVPALAPPPIATARPPRRAPAKPPRGPLIAIQLGAFASQDAALSILRDLKATRPELSERIELISAGKTIVYRALLTGFRTRREAAGYCRDLVKLHRLCLVRGIR